MGIKFKLTLRKEYEVDTDRDWNGDMNGLLDKLRDDLDVEPGTEASVDEIHDAIRAMLEDDIETVVDLALDHTDFEIEVPTGTTLSVPEEPEDEDAA